MRVKIILFVLLILLLPSLSYYPINAKEILEIDENNFVVVQTFWGSSANIQDVGPGDQKVTLNVEIQNIGTKTYAGIRGFLTLKDPFSNSTGGGIASGFINGQLIVGQTAILSFPLNVAEDASLGNYQISMRLEYLIPAIPLYTAAEEYLTIPVYLLGNVELEITASPESLSEGDNNVTFKISNVGSGKASSVSIDFTSPPNLPIIGDDNHWFFNSILPEEDVNINLRFFVDTSIISQSIEFQVSISFIDPYGSGKMINRIVGLKVDTPLVYQDVLTVSVDNNLLIVGVVNEPSIKIVNSGNKTINSLVATLTFPTITTGSSPLTILSSNEWRFDNLDPRVEVSFMSKILPALGSIDNSYQAQLSLSYRDEDGDIHIETKTIGFNVRGRAIFLLLNEQVSPDAIGPGDIFTISGDLINTGTTRALYTSSYAYGSTIFSTFSDSEYIGEIDPNVPTPFSISVKVSEETKKGTYPLTIFFMYQDDYGKDFKFQKTFEIEIGESSNSQTNGTPEPPSPSNWMVLVFSQFLIPAIIIIAILITIVIFIRRRRKKEKELI